MDESSNLCQLWLYEGHGNWAAKASRWTYRYCVYFLFLISKYFVKYLLILCVELERLRKLGLKSVTDGSAVPPVVPARQRHNPFNLMERETSSNMATRKVIKKQNFTSIHNEYGQQIMKDRDVWKKDRKANFTSVIREDVLITL